jgi:hypothetical protein
MGKFSRLGQLEELQVGGIKVGDKGLMGVLALPNLLWVNVAGTKVTDRSIEKLNDAVLSVNLGWTAVTDASADRLAKCERLKRLDLGHTEITGLGLEKLAALVNLEDLNLAGTQVTDADVGRFIRTTRSNKVHVTR